MKRTFFLMLIPLLVLTAGLCPSEQVIAQPKQLPAFDINANVNSFRTSKGLTPYQVKTLLIKIVQTHGNHNACTGVIARFEAGCFLNYQRALKARYSVASDLSVGGLFSGALLSAGVGELPAGAVNTRKTNADEFKAVVPSDFTDVGATTGETSTPMVTVTQGTQPAPVILSTPLENGDVYHMVQAKEALWSIALAYRTTVEQLKSLNHLASDEIFVGQKLLIIKSVPASATPSPVVTATFGIPTSTSTRPASPTVPSTATPLPTPPNSPQSAATALGVIVLAALLTAGLIAWLSRKRSE